MIRMSPIGHWFASSFKVLHSCGHHFANMPKLIMGGMLNMGTFNGRIGSVHSTTSYSSNSPRRTNIPIGGSHFEEHVLPCLQRCAMSNQYAARP